MDVLVGWTPTLGPWGLAVVVIATVLRRLLTGQLMSRRTYLDMTEPLRAQAIEDRATKAAYQETIRLLTGQLAEAQEAARMGVRVMQAMQQHVDQQNTTEQPRAAVGRATVYRGP